MAFILVREFNAIHNRGLNIEGELVICSLVDVRVLPNRNNTGSTSTELVVTDYNLVDQGKVTFTYDADRASGTAVMNMANLSPVGVTRSPCQKCGSISGCRRRFRPVYL